jgi:hypothetical protein
MIRNSFPLYEIIEEIKNFNALLSCERRKITFKDMYFGARKQASLASAIINFLSY